MENVLLTIIIVIVILMVVFLVLREVNCWYWKINERISLQQEQNFILKKILKELKNDPKSKQKSTSSKNKGDYNMDKTLDIEKDEEKLGSKDEDMIYDIELTTNEQKQVDAFIKYGIKPGERLAINKTTRIIDRFDDKEWNKLDQNEWIILIEK